MSVETLKKVYSRINELNLTIKNSSEPNIRLLSEVESLNNSIINFKGKTFLHSKEEIVHKLNSAKLNKIALYLRNAEQERKDQIEGSIAALEFVKDLAK